MLALTQYSSRLPWTSGRERRRTQRGGCCRARSSSAARLSASTRSWLSQETDRSKPFSSGGSLTMGGDAQGQGHHGGHVGCSSPTVRAHRQTKHMRRCARRSTVRLQNAASPCQTYCQPQPGCAAGRTAQGQGQPRGHIDTLLLTLWDLLHPVQMLRKPR